jgi:hypothetical protein
VSVEYYSGDEESLRKRPGKTDFRRAADRRKTKGASSESARKSTLTNMHGSNSSGSQKKARIVIFLLRYRRQVLRLRWWRSGSFSRTCKPFQTREREPCIDGGM